MQVVFIYLIVTVIMYVTGDNISVYEVREGSIVNDNSYTGLVIRQETAVTAETGGYVSYYQNENSKIKAGTNVYAVSAQLLIHRKKVKAVMFPRLLIRKSSPESFFLSRIITRVPEVRIFSPVYTLKNEITNSLQNAFSDTRMSQLDAVIAASGQEVNFLPVGRRWIIAFSVDGYESLTKDTFTDENFDRSKYESMQLSDRCRSTPESRVYRLIYQRRLVRDRSALQGDGRRYEEERDHQCEGADR